MEQKLYTEEQVMKAMVDYIQGTPRIDVINSLTPIQLPSDEDIYSVLRGKKMLSKDWGFIEGAKWMRNKILNK
jgi:hypothetical protein